MVAEDCDVVEERLVWVGRNDQQNAALSAKAIEAGGAILMVR